eukprot:scaffold1075_cov104-Cylindrotheca_fusiformis.AAC.3
MIREDLNHWGRVVEETKLELGKGAYRGLKTTTPALNLRQTQGRSTSRFKIHRRDTLSLFQLYFQAQQIIPFPKVCMWLFTNFQKIPTQQRS